jgi:hypothetical protein
MITMGKKDQAIRDGLKNPKVIARFNKKIIYKDNGCIEFIGSKSAKGYGVFSIHSKNNPMNSVRAHRFSYALAYGIDKLPSGTDKTQNRKVLHHKCENKACVNPLHLEVVTDRWNLGRSNDKNMF